MFLFRGKMEGNWIPPSKRWFLSDTILSPPATTSTMPAARWFVLAVMLLLMSRYPHPVSPLPRFSKIRSTLLSPLLLLLWIPYHLILIGSYCTHMGVWNDRHGPPLFLPWARDSADSSGLLCLLTLVHSRAFGDLPNGWLLPSHLSHVSQLQTLCSSPWWACWCLPSTANWSGHSFGFSISNLISVLLLASLARLCKHLFVLTGLQVCATFGILRVPCISACSMLSGGASRLVLTLCGWSDFDWVGILISVTPPLDMFFCLGLSPSHGRANDSP